MLWSPSFPTLSSVSDSELTLHCHHPHCLNSCWQICSIIKNKNTTPTHTKTSSFWTIVLWTKIIWRWCACCMPSTWQSSLSCFPFFSWPAQPHCTQLDPKSCLTFQRGIWHWWKLGLLSYYLCLQILQHFVAVSVACCGKAWIFDCMNVGVFISPVSSLLRPVIHFSWFSPVSCDIMT